MGTISLSGVIAAAMTSTAYRSEPQGEVGEEQSPASLPSTETYSGETVPFEYKSLVGGDDELSQRHKEVEARTKRATTTRRDTGVRKLR